MIAKSHRWHKTAIAAAALALLGLSGSGALALSLGRITVQSSLGEPLRAEIDVPDINAEEAASLRASVASPDAFTAAGLDYNAVMTNVRATLLRRADGRSYLRLTSERAINDPFVDMILEASWSSGRIVRDYTMLFDPPSLKQAAPAPTLPQTSGAVAAAPRVAPAQTESVQADAQRSGSAVKKPAAPAATPAPAKLDAAGGKQIAVKEGDTASKIASQAKSSDVSLDQMLVALMRANPDAFARGNINRLRAGAVLDLPSADQAKSIDTTEATQMVVAQSKDFNEFRRNLATNAPKAAVEAADRKSAGKLEAKVEDKKPSGSVPDKLTLSKGAIQGKADEAKIAKDRADKEAASRAAELAKNISDLNKLGAASAKVSPAAPASAPAPTSPAPAIAVATAPAPVVSTPASAPAEKPPAKAAPMPVAPATEPGILDELLADPVVPAAGVGLAALLAGAALWVQRRRKQKAAHVDSSFLESRLQPDSFFGASGGQRVDTANDAPSGASSSMSYSHSQLDAADDVDPVAEADVYLAYGRDLQAEEILKEAIKHNPGRLAIHTKLLEIFAKRRDTGNFQNSATQAFKLCGADSPEWARVCELGLTIDPSNPLYQPGGATSSAFVSLETAAPEESPSASDGTMPVSAHGEMPDTSSNVDLDLDLDFSADDVPAVSAPNEDAGMAFDIEPPPAPLAPAATEQTTRMEVEAPEMENGLDFDISAPGELSATPEPAPSPEPASAEMPSLDMDSFGSLDLPDFDAGPAAAPQEPAAQAPAAKADDGMLEFDLGSLSLDLDMPASNELPSGEDPLETKLALAEEFVSIGDSDGARALIEEVVAEASGELRAKAERALASLS